MVNEAVDYCLTADSLVFSYGDTTVLKNVTFSLEPGKVLAVIGRSGCGKTTLLKILCGLLVAKSGTVTLDGTVVMAEGQLLVNPGEVRRHAIMVPQERTLLPWLTSLDNVALPLRTLRNCSHREATELAIQQLSLVGLGAVGSNYPEELSGGQYVRAQLARALVLEPDLLLLDEVTAALDPISLYEVAEHLNVVRTRTDGSRRTVVLVSHHIQFAFGLADEVLFLNDGVNFESAAAKSFLKAATKPETREFLKVLGYD
jgi:polar amino acid transport system ATP-binding protein